MSEQYGSYQGQPYDENQASGYGAQGSYGAPGSYGSGAGYGDSAPMQASGPGRPLASWGVRAGARIIDSLLSAIIVLALTIPGLIIALHGAHKVRDFDGTTHVEGDNPAGYALIAVGVLAALLFGCWNLGVRQGKTGQSIGKKMLHILVIDENTNAPTGAGAGFGRYAVEIGFGVVNSCVGVLSLLDILWPLWDAKNQTLHDKVVHTLVVRENS